MTPFDCQTEDMLELITDVICEVELPAPVVVSHRWLVAMLVRRELARRLQQQRKEAA